MRNDAILHPENVMVGLIQQHRDEIARLCRAYRVRRLAAFGSALRPDFDPAHSDIDFLVEFEPSPVAERMQHYLGLRQALAALFAQPVDLIEDGAIRNPYIVESVAAAQQVLYAA